MYLRFAHDAKSNLGCWLMRGRRLSTSVAGYDFVERACVLTDKARSMKRNKRRTVIVLNRSAELVCVPVYQAAEMLEVETFGCLDCSCDLYSVGMRLVISSHIEFATT